MFDFDKVASTLRTHCSRDGAAETPLHAVRVIDFSHYVAAPYATMLLADMGAEVIKVEAPGKGEDLRHYPPGDSRLPLQSAPYLWANRNKRSLAADLKNPEGLRIIRELIQASDVLVENFSTGVMERFGLSYEACRELNPRLIYCSVSAYGRTGAFSDRLGFDSIVQAESGFMSMNGYPDREGVRTASTVMDISTAMMASNAILAALLARERTGKGQFIEAALFDTAVTMAGFATMNHLCSGVEPVRFANSPPDTAPSGVFKTQDNSVYILCSNSGIFQRLFENVLGCPKVAHDPEYATGPGRVRARVQLCAAVQDKLQAQPWSYWQPRLRAARIPNGVVRTLGEALASDEVAERGLVTKIPHPEAGWIPNIGLPIRFSDTPLADPVAAPALGQHTAAVLAEILGYSKEQVAFAIASGAVSTAEPLQ